MSALDLDAIRSFVLTSLDTDTDEIPFSLLDIYISEGFDRIVEASTQWSFYAQEATLTTVAGQQAYNFGGSDTERDDAFAYAALNILDVRGATFSCRPLAHAAVRAAMRTTSPSSARPWGFSEFGDSLYLWPIPDSAYTITIAYYRKPIDWVALGSGSEPDCPDEFHEVIAYHALSRGFAMQADPDMASFYSTLFDQRVKTLKSRYATPRTSGPFIQNGGLNIDPYTRNGLGPLIYPWG